MKWTKKAKENQSRKMRLAWKKNRSNFLRKKSEKRKLKPIKPICGKIASMKRDNILGVSLTNTGMVDLWKFCPNCGKELKQ